MATLEDSGVLHADVPGKVARPQGLTFEQQRELMQLRFEHDLQMQRSSDRREEARRELELQVFRLELIREGKLSGDGNPTAARACDIAGSLRLVPKFNEQDPDVFLTLFEWVAELREWSDADRLCCFRPCWWVKCRTPMGL